MNSGSYRCDTTDVGLVFRDLPGDAILEIRPKSKSEIVATFVGTNHVGEDVQVGPKQLNFDKPEKRSAFVAEFEELLNAPNGNGSRVELLPIAEKIARALPVHLKERRGDADDHHEKTADERFAGTPYLVTGRGGEYGFARRRDPIDENAPPPPPAPLTNFLAKIVEDAVLDDSVETRRTYHLQASVRGQTRTFEVPADEFRSMRWVDKALGVHAMVMPGASNLDHAQAAIRLYSPDAKEHTYFTHTGWRLVNGEYVYLHAGGAIAAAGLVSFSEANGQSKNPKTENVDHVNSDTYTDSDEMVGLVSKSTVGGVQLSGDSSHRLLPEPPSKDELRSAILASWALTKLAPGHITIPLFGGIYRATMGENDVAIHIAGGTGVFKTELAVLAQRHYGPGLDAGRTFSWNSTANALVEGAFRLKDQIAVYDDYLLKGEKQTQEMKAKADQVLRSKGNKNARSRLASDLSQRPDRPPRALVVSTGEDIPDGQSLRARLAICEVAKGDIPVAKLTLAQKHASGGEYARAMSGFLQWLAPQYGRLERERGRLHDDLRNHAATPGGDEHYRTPHIVAELALGVNWFLRFALEAGAMDLETAEYEWSRAWSGLMDMAKRQPAYQASAEPTEQVRNLLRSALLSGDCHIANDDDQTGHMEPEPPVEPWGWRIELRGDAEVRVAQGARIGYLQGDKLLINPKAALKIAQAQNRGAVESFSISQSVLSKRMAEKGLLVEVDSKRGTLTKRKTVAGSRPECWVVDKGFFDSAGGSTGRKTDQPDQLGRKPDTYEEKSGHPPLFFGVGD